MEVKEQPYVVAVDPGYTTGICICGIKGLGPDGKAEFDVYNAFEIKWEERFSSLLSLAKSIANSAGPEAIVCEAFRLYPHTAASQARIHSDFPSVQVIGILQAYLYQVDRTYIPDHDETVWVFQQAAQMKSVKVLPDHRPPLKGLTHARDAYRHARYWIVTHVHT